MKRINKSRWREFEDVEKGLYHTTEDDDGVDDLRCASVKENEQLNVSENDCLALATVTKVFLKKRTKSYFPCCLSKVY